MATDGRRDMMSKVSRPFSGHSYIVITVLWSTSEVQGGCSSWSISLSALCGGFYSECSTDPGLLENSGAGGMSEHSKCVCVRGGHWLELFLLCHMTDAGCSQQKRQCPHLLGWWMWGIADDCLCGAKLRDWQNRRMDFVRTQVSRTISVMAVAHHQHFIRC